MSTTWIISLTKSYLFFAMLLVVCGKTLVSVQLYDFYNADSHSLDGGCCDNFGSFCVLKCDNWFEICVAPIPVKDWTNCIYYAKTNVFDNNDELKFPGFGMKIGPNNLRNPLSFLYDGPFIGFGFLANVWDDDGGRIFGKEDEKIDEYRNNILVKPVKFSATPFPNITRLAGRQSDLGVIVRAQCVKDWYDEKCSTYCVSRDDQGGHYTCDPENGNKVCKTGWTGHNCAEAVCHQTCDLQNANCSKPNGCDCFSGWEDTADDSKKCSQCIPKKGCKNGYCVLGNDCHCKTDWVGELCTMDNNTCRHFPCQNGGGCLNSGLDQYKCNCKPGYTGVNCSTEIDLCASKPCTHGFCLNHRTRYTCLCQSGYSGINCDEDINDCDPNPCQNNGTCNDRIASYNCTCVLGFNGDNCQNNINECENNKCQHGSRCVDGIANYTCECRGGYTGVYCETDIDDCLKKPCVNGACIDLINSFRCNCTMGYSGRLCSNNTDDCDPNPCKLGGTCQDLVDDYNCTCLAGFTGKNCEIDINECLPGICHDGICVDGPNNYTCTCNSGFTGQNCSINIDDCAVKPMPCQNNAVCIDGIDDFTCQCKSGWTGKDCSVNIDDCLVPCVGIDPQIHSCLKSPCMNVAKCVDAVNNFICQCRPGFEGRLCNERIDYCTLYQACENGAACVNVNATYTCNCKPGFAGRNCSTNIDDCQLQPCQNGANCTDGVASFTCQCPRGFDGKYCENNINNCDPRNPQNINNIPEGKKLTSWGFCGKHGHCEDRINSFYCNCSQGYKGQYCSSDINECADDPCNNGTCYENQDKPGYICSCFPGFNGTNCEININECDLGHKCCGKNTCVDGINGYSCSCPNGLKGIDCCSKTSWCDDNSTCSYNGVCKDVLTSSSKEAVDFQCECELGYIGKRCETDINECLSSPCHSGATCLNTQGNFMCLCPIGKTGRNCKTEINDCEGIKCLNGFECIDKSNEFECSCPKQGFKHPFCEDMNECNQTGRCPSDRKCVNKIGGYDCVCLDGWTGADCKYSVDDCVHHNCSKYYSKRCVDLHQGFKCECFEKWEGEICSERKENSSLTEDECGCLHGGCYLNEKRIKKCECDFDFEGEKCREPRRKATKGEKEALGTSAAVGIAIGAVGFIASLIVLSIFLRRRRYTRSNSKLENEEEKTKAPSFHMKFENELFEQGGDLMFQNPTFNIGFSNSGAYMDEDMEDKEPY